MNFFGLYRNNANHPTYVLIIHCVDLSPLPKRLAYVRSTHWNYRLDKNKSEKFINSKYEYSSVILVNKVLCACWTNLSYRCLDLSNLRNYIKLSINLFFFFLKQLIPFSFLCFSEQTLWKNQKSPSM